MESIIKFTDWLWGYPIVILLFVASVFLSFYLKGIQFRYFFYIIKQTFLALISLLKAKERLHQDKH